MAIRMSGGVVKRTDGFYARKTIPADIRKHFPAKKRKGAQFQTDFFKKVEASSLRQAEAQAKRIHAEWDRIIELARAGEWPQPSQREIILLAGEFWKWARTSSKEPQYLMGSLVGARGETRMRAMLAQFLAARGLPYRSGGPTNEMIFARAYQLSDLEQRNESAARLGAVVDGIEADWAPISAALKGEPVRAPASKTYAFSTLIEDWARDTGKNTETNKTVYSWRQIVAKLTAYLGHDNAAAVSHEDRIRWKDALVIAGEIGPTTIENHLIVVQTLLNWAFENKRIPTRPEPVKYKAKKAQGTRKRGYTDAEAKRILLAARAETKPYRRWLPWIAAFNGARIEEIAGAFVPDIEKINGIVCLHIRPDYRGREIKNEGSIRCIPIHSAVISEGFLNYVRKLPQHGPLFPDVTPDRFGSRGGNATKSIGRWIRDKLKLSDPRLSPTHSWRHRFESQHRMLGIRDDITDAITGHHDGQAATNYGEHYVKETLYPAIEQIPNPVLLANAI
ncbi:MAG TPA: site-specific integrase [Stellaceae bacterium]|nr:site-specific integrase [Stellaceae bacterium]